MCYLQANEIHLRSANGVFNNFWSYELMKINRLLVATLVWQLIDVYAQHLIDVLSTYMCSVLPV